MLTPDRPGVHERPRIGRVAGRTLGPLFGSLAQGKEAAARPAIAALAATSLPKGAYIGPHRVATGVPILAEPVETSRDRALGQFMWEQTEELLGAPILGS